MVDFSRDVQDMVRLQKVVRVLANSGFGKYLLTQELREHVPLVKRFISAPADPKTQAIRLRKAFMELGPTYVKLGQLLSVRPDLVPEEYCEAFKYLQDRVDPISFDEVRKIIEQDLKRSLKSLFKSIESEPVASASIAQVHRAQLKDGRRVAVKVQRPGIAQIIDTDLDILIRLARALEMHIEAVRPYRPIEVVKEFALWSRRELDFTREAAAAVRLGEILKENKGVRVPKVYLEMCSRRVLTMEYVEGVRMDEPGLYSGRGGEHKRKEVVLRYFIAILEQALGGGFFHADPHPANILIDTRGNLVFLDLGIMGELSESDRLKIITFITSLKGRNPQRNMETIISMARDVRGADIEAFKEEALPLLHEAYVRSIGENSVGKVLYEIIKAGSKHGVRFDPNQILMAKALYQAEGIGLAMDPGFKVAEGITAFAEKYLKQYYSPRKVLLRAKYQIMEHKELLLDLPEHLARVFSKLEGGSSDDEHGHITREEFLVQEEKMYKNVQGIMIVALIIVLGVAASVMLYAGETSKIMGIGLSYWLLLIAIALLVWYWVR